MKFLFKGETDDKGRTLGEAIVAHVKKHPPDTRAREDALLNVIAAMADHLAPWHKKQMGEALGFVQING
jgi:hypothetical protein